jgi:hypothetical protein
VTVAAEGLAWDGAVERLAARLRERVPLRWRPPEALLPAGRSFTAAAVLVPLFAPDLVIYTARRADLEHHAGQACFPGGKRDATDPDLAFTALRETGEELGLARDGFDVLGPLDAVFTPSGFQIWPYVARWMGSPLRAADVSGASGEVAAVYHAPLSVLADPRIYTARAHAYGAIELPSHEFALPEIARDGGGVQPAVRIWGATGRITRQLVDLAG